MRFKDIEFNANVKIEEIAPPERIISGFALEIFGTPLAVRIRTLSLPYMRMPCPQLNKIKIFLCSYAGR